MSGLTPNPYEAGTCDAQVKLIEYEVRIRARAYVTLLPAVLATAVVGAVGGLGYAFGSGELQAVGGLLAAVGLLALVSFGYGFAAIRWQFPRLHWLLLFPLIPTSMAGCSALGFAPLAWLSTLVHLTLWACSLDAMLIAGIALTGWGALLRFPFRTPDDVDAVGPARSEAIPVERDSG